MLKRFIRQWLGITEIQEDQAMLNQNMQGLGSLLRNLHGGITVHNRALGRIIAKVDPHFARDPLDPAVRAESDRIGEEALKRIYAEHAASNNPHG